MVYQYRHKILADSPVSYWRLGGAATPTDLTTRPVAIDQINANPGAYVGANWQAEILADTPVSLWKLAESAPSAADSLTRLAAADDQGANPGSYIGSNWEAEVLADSPASLWKLAESSGTTAADVQGANAGTYNLGNQSTFSDSLATNTLASYSTVRGTAFVQGGGGFQSQVVNGDNFFVRTDNGFYNGAVTVKVAIGSTVPNIAAVMALTDNSHWLIAYISSGNQLSIEADNGGVVPTATAAFTPQPNTTYWIRVDRNGSNATATVYSSDPALGASPLATASLTGDSNVGVLGQLRPGMYANVGNAAGQVHTYNNLTLSPNSGSNSLGQTGPLTSNSDTAVLLDGASGYVSTTTVPAASSSAFALEAWVHPTDTSGVYVIVGRTNSAFQWYLNSGKQAFYMNASMAMKLSTSVVPAGQWSHVAVTWDGTNVTFYLNGVADGSSAPTNTSVNATTAFTIGAHPIPGQFFKGDIFGVAFFNGSALSAQRILAHYTAGKQTALTLAQSGPLTSNSDTAVLLDGASGYVSVADSTSDRIFGLASWSAEAWVKAPLTQNVAIFSKTDNVTAGSDIEVLGSGAIKLNFGSTTLSSNTGAVSAGIWTHIAVTFDGATIRFYANGAAVGSTASVGSGNINNNAEPLRIGARKGDLFLNGDIFGVAVYNTVLSAQRILTHYTAGKQTALTLGAAGALGGSGDSDTAVTADGASGYVSVPDSISQHLSGSFTAEGWVKPTDRASQYYVHSFGTGANPYVETIIGTNGKVTVFIDGSNQFTSTGAVSIGTYTHVVATWDGTKIRIYFNGVLDSTSGSLVRGSTAPAATNYIGSGSAVTEFFKGTLDEVAVYNYALSAAQILEHYTLGISVM